MSRHAVATIVGFLVLTSSLSAQFATNSLRGSFSAGTVVVTALGADGKPASDVRIEIIASSRQTIASAVTGPAGVIEFEGVPSGSYEVVITKGVNQASEQLLAQGSFSTIKVRLPGDGSDDIGSDTRVSVAQFRVPKKARSELKKAQKALDANEIEKAHKHVARALELHPSYAEGLTLRGILRLNAQENEAAANDFDAAIKADPAYSLAYFAMGATFNRLNRYDDALRTLERGVALDPQSWQGYFEIAKAQIGKADYPKAISSLDRAQSLLTTKYPPLHLVKAHAMLALKQYGEAMLELQVFLEQAPQAPQSAAAREMLEQARAFAAGQ